MTHQDLHWSGAENEPSSGLLFRQASQTDTPRARLLLLHGVGGNESNLTSLAPYLSADLELMVLRGPRQLGPGAFAWFEVSFTSEGPRINAKQEEESRHRLVSFIDALPPLPTAIAGFSQGGIMSAGVALTAPSKVRGFGLLSGRILPELRDQIAPREELSSLSGFVAHGHHDTKLPYFWADQAVALLTEVGVPHQAHSYEMGHEITRTEITDFSYWVNETLSLA